MAAYALYAGQYLLLFIAFMVFTGAQQERIAADARQLFTGVPVRAAMSRDVRAIQHGSTLGDAVGQIADTTQQFFPVLHGGRAVGLLTRSALTHALDASGPAGYVAGVMSREFVTVSPDLDLADALPLMSRGADCALVVDGDELVGLLSSRDIGEFFARRAAQPR